MKTKHTPVESVAVKGKTVWVKREDLCFSFPAPPFSKMRGLYEHLKKKKEQGYDTITYVETSVSMAGWGIAWACKDLGLRCVILDPQEKEPPVIHLYHRKMWKELGAEIVQIPAGRAVVGYRVAKKALANRRKTYIAPLGLPFAESILATEQEFRYTVENQIAPKTVVVCVGSGTICAGIVRAAVDYGSMEIVGVMSRTGNPAIKKKVVIEKAGIPYHFSNISLRIEDPGWEYTEPCRVKTPFPSHPYYDKKAWDFLVKRVYSLKEPILFWNIGSMKLTERREDHDQK